MSFLPIKATWWRCLPIGRLLWTEILSQLSAVSMHFWWDINSIQRMSSSEFGNPLTFRPITMRMTFLVLIKTSWHSNDSHDESSDTPSSGTDCRTDFYLPNTLVWGQLPTYASWYWHPGLMKKIRLWQLINDLNT